MRNKLFFLFVFFSLAKVSFSQPGGKSTFDFLNIPQTARISSLAGAIPIFHDGDINIAVANPSLINEGINNNLVLNFLNYYAGVKTGYAGYSKTYQNSGSFLAGMQFINYGKFISAEPTGEITGTFSAGEYAFNLGWGKKIDSSFSIGSNVKSIYSYFERYNSFGLGIDLAANYVIPKSNFGFSILFKNMGYQLISYTQKTSDLPFNVQFVVSKKLLHAPLQFTLLANNLNRLNLGFVDPSLPTVNPITGEPIPVKNNYFDNVMRHLIFGAEILPGKNVQLRIGYNYMIRKDLSPEARSGISGFSFGFGLRVSKFNISYARAAYHLSGATNSITVATNLSSF